MLKILITGGSGRLASELKKHLDGEYVGIENWDFVYDVPRGYYDLILHMGAWTNVLKAEEEPQKCFDTNVKGTFNIMQTYKDVPIIYISTEYANKPLGVYALTKQLGEEIIKTHPHHLILRTCFKPRPFPFESAFIDQYTQGDYTDVIAKLLADKVNTWDRKTCGLGYLGTGRKTMFELAQQTRPDVKPSRVKDWNDFTGKGLMPTDYA